MKSIAIIYSTMNLCSPEAEVLSDVMRFIGEGNLEAFRIAFKRVLAYTNNKFSIHTVDLEIFGYLKNHCRKSDKTQNILTDCLKRVSEISEQYNSVMQNDNIH